MKDKIHNKPYLKEFRRELRNNMMPSEARLWSVLSGKKVLNKKFRRQHSIGNYIVDFFCFEENLIIEIDGNSHDDPGSQLNDQGRDKYLEENGFRILCFKALDIINHLEAVVNEIERNILNK